MAKFHKPQTIKTFETTDFADYTENKYLFSL